MQSSNTKKWIQEALLLPTAYRFQGFAMIARSERYESRSGAEQQAPNIHIYYVLKHLVSRTEVIECRDRSRFNLSSIRTAKEFRREFRYVCAEVSGRTCTEQRSFGRIPGPAVSRS